MKNPCGKNTGMKNPATKETHGKMTQVFGKKGTAKKFIIGGK